MVSVAPLTFITSQLNKPFLAIVTLCCCLASVNSFALPQSLNDFRNAGPYGHQTMYDTTYRDYFGSFLPRHWDGSECRIFYPSDMNAAVDDIGRLPVVLWSNGTMGDTDFLHTHIQEHLASHGFIVAATRSRWTGTGEEAIICLEQALKLNEESGSPLYQKVNANRVCSTGHSQGGGAAIMTGIDERIRCTAPIEPFWRNPLDANDPSDLAVECKATLWDPFSWLCPAIKTVANIALEYDQSGITVALMDQFVSFLGQIGLGTGDLAFGHDVRTHQQQNGPMLLLSGAMDQLAWPGWHHDSLFAVTGDSTYEMVINQPVFYLLHPNADHFHVTDLPFSQGTGNTFLAPLTAWMYWHLRDYNVAQNYFVGDHSALATYTGVNWAIQKRGNIFNTTTAELGAQEGRTPRNSDGSGENVYLDRHNMDCGYDGINSFRLFRPSTEEIAYRYNCLETMDSQSTDYYSPWANWNSGSNHALANLPIDCTHESDLFNKAIQSIQLTRPTSSDIAYRYHCGHADLTDISDHYTPWNADGSGNNIFLDRHNVACPSDKVLTYVVLQVSGSNIRYHYRCGAPVRVQFDKISVSGITASTWHRVDFEQHFRTKPVVVMGPLSRNGSDPATVRVRNVTTQGFEFLVQEWDYLDGNHADETISYLAAPAGNYYWGDLEIDAGTIGGVDENWTPVYYDEGFAGTPVVLAQQVSSNGGQASAVRIRNSSNFSFEVMVQEEEGNDGNHALEDISYISIKPGSGFIPGTKARLTVGLTGSNVNDTWHSVNFGGADFPVDAAFLANMQTTNGADPASLRWQNQNSSGIDVKVEEEQSFDTETGHANENVGWVLMDSPTLVNVAAGNAAYQSSTGWSGAAERAVDGNTDGEWGSGSVTHTALETNARWKVLFGAGHDLTGVTLWNRTDCCTERLANLRVEYLDANQNIIKYQDYTREVARRVDIVMTAANVHGVRIRLLGSTARYLSLAEVQAWAPMDLAGQ